MKNIIASLLLMLSLTCPALILAQESVAEAPETEAQVAEDQAVPAIPVEAAPVTAEETVPENSNMKRKSKKDLINEVEDLVERAASGDITGAEKEAIKLRIRALRDRIDDNTSAPWESDSLGTIGGMFVGGLAIVLIFGTPIMLLAAVLYASYRKRRLIHNTIDQYVSSGRDIPPEVLQSLHKDVSPANTLHRGLFWSGAGLGVIACFLVMGTREAAALGLIPLFIGLAQLLIWKLEKK